MLFQIEDNTDYTATSKTFSDSLRICPCENSLPDCTGSQCYSVPHTVYPGETFQISVVAVGQGDETVPSIVRITARTNIIGFHPSRLSIPPASKQHLHQTQLHCIFTVTKSEHRIASRRLPMLKSTVSCSELNLLTWI